VDLFKEMTDSDNTPEDDPGVIVDALVSEAACAHRFDFWLWPHHAPLRQRRYHT